MPSLWMTPKSSVPLYYAEMSHLVTMSTILNSVTNQSVSRKPDDSLALQSVIFTFHPIKLPCPLCLPTLFFSDISLFVTPPDKLGPTPCHFMLALPLWSLCPLYWPLFRAAALDLSARGCCPWIPVWVCLHSSCCTAALPPPCYAFL